MSFAVLSLILLMTPLSWAAESKLDQLFSQLEAKGAVGYDDIVQDVDEELRRTPKSDAERLADAESIAKVIDNSRIDPFVRKILIQFGLAEIHRGTPRAPIVLAVARVYRAEARVAGEGNEMTVRDSAAYFLAHQGDPAITRELLTEALNLSSPLGTFARRAVLSNAGRIATRDLLPTLRALLNAEVHPDIKVGVALLIAQLDPRPENLPTLKKAVGWDIKNGNNTEGVLAQIYEAALRIGTPEAQSWVVSEMLKDTHNLRTFGRSFSFEKYPDLIGELVRRAPDRVKLMMLDNTQYNAALKPALQGAMEGVFRNEATHERLRASAVRFLVEAGRVDLLEDFYRAAMAAFASGNFERYSGGGGDSSLMIAVAYAFYKAGEMDRLSQLLNFMMDQQIEVTVSQFLIPDQEFIDYAKDFADKRRARERAQISATDCAPAESPAVVTPQVQELASAAVSISERVESSLDEAVQEALNLLAGFRHSGGVKAEFLPREHGMPLLALEPVQPKEGIVAEKQARLVGEKFGAVEKILNNYLNLPRDRRVDPAVQGTLKREVRAHFSDIRTGLDKLENDHHHGRAVGERILEFLVKVL